MNTPKEISDIVMALAQKMGQDPIDVMEDYQHFYKEHRDKHGSYAPLIGTEWYDKKMEERFSWVLGQILMKYNGGGG